MDAILKFKEAAKELQNDDRYILLDAARQRNDADEELQTMLRDFSTARIELNEEMAKDDRDEDKVTQLNMRINQLYNSVMTNENMLAYNAAKQGMESMVSHINAILSAAIDGGDPMTVEEPVACGSGGCSGCSGCG